MQRVSISNGGLRPCLKECESPVPSRPPWVDRRLVMNSPDQDDADKQFMNALPWVSDPQHEDETRRLQEDVAKAALRLRESSRLASQARAQPSQQRTDVGLRLTEAHSIGDDVGLRLTE